MASKAKTGLNPSKAPRRNLLEKLRLRETRGKVAVSGNGIGKRNERLFSRLPARLAFCLKDVVPFSAIEAGHVFIGFSSCGQFLLSYTQSCNDNDNDLTAYHYVYR